MTLPHALDGRLPALLPALLPARPFVVLDYDGTLVSITDRPEEAVIDEATRSAVAAVAERMPVAVLSGRALDDVAARVGLPELVYAGCHGLSIRGPGLCYEHEGAAARADEVDGAAASLREALAPIEGAIVEHKGLTVAAHRRLVAPERQSEVERIAREIGARFAGLRTMPGKMVDELVPDVDWNKGHALSWLLDTVAPDAHPIYLGDDLTDEDAFAAIAGRGTGILVADAPRSSAAETYLRDPAEVRRFLEALAPRK